MTVDTWEATGFVTASDYRRRVMHGLNYDARTPTELEEVTGITITHVSRALSQLKEKGLVKLRENSSGRRRFYELTEPGRETLENVEAVSDR